MLCVCVVLACLETVAAEPPRYYASAEGKTGAELQAALHAIVRGHRVIPYSSGTTNTAQALMVLEEDAANTNNVVLFYSRRSDPKSAFATSGGWNREHVWPNSYGLDSHQPAYSDLHNLRAEDSTVNDARQNKYFDVSDTRSASFRFPAHPEAPFCSTDSDSWEPPLSVRGDVARALFYMVVRYTGDTNIEPALFLTDATGQLDVLTNLMARMTTLLLWHQADPVDDSERRRNDLIFEFYQRNRNPFVDRSEWVRAAFWPELTMTLSGTNLTVNWPAEYTAAVLEYSAQFSSGWVSTGGNRATNGRTISVTFFLPPESPAAGFFRLRSQ